MKRYLVVFIAFIIVWAGTAYGDYYIWEDENGVKQVTDYPPPEMQKAKNMKVHKMADPPAQPDEQASKAEPKPDIVLYTKNACTDCDKARNFLQSANLTFTEYNIDTDASAVEKRKVIDGSVDVPFAIINRTQLYGFSEKTYNRALKLTP